MRAPQPPELETFEMADETKRITIAPLEPTDGDLPISDDWASAIVEIIGELISEPQPRVEQYQK